MMSRLTKFIARTLSFRLSLMVLVALATLLMAALFIMFSYSRRALKDEALLKAEQTLETTVQSIDNILLDVEQSAGNIYWKLANHIREPEKVEAYVRKLAEVSPYIVDAQFVWKTDSTTIEYTLPTWTESQGTNITSFCLPLYLGSEIVGMLKADVSSELLSKIVLENKPSPNSQCSLLGKDGSYIIHPDTSTMDHYLASALAKRVDASIKETIGEMVAGKTGYKALEIHDEDYYVFYKPFERSAVPGRYIESLGWSAGIVYPENDIFGDYNRLLYTVLIVAFVGLFLLLLLCQTFIHRQLLPLRQLSKWAQRVAQGDYNELITLKRQQDEVGRLQHHFQGMQQSLATHVGEMKRLSDTLQERGEVLQAAYEQAQVADAMKTNFLYNMSNQMTNPVEKIVKSVKTICEQYNNLTEEETYEQVDVIQHQGEKITALLNQLIADSEKKS